MFGRASSAFDTVAKLVAAAAAVAAIYTWAVSAADDVVPVVLSVVGSAYFVLLPVAGVWIVYLEHRYWRGPVIRRPSFTSYGPGTPLRGIRPFPTRWERQKDARRWHQVLTLPFGALAALFFGFAVYATLADAFRDGFPAEWPSTVSWFGVLGLVLVVFVGAMALKNRVTNGPRNKKRCMACGGWSWKGALKRPGCGELFPSGVLLEPKRPGE